MNDTQQHVPHVPNEWLNGGGATSLIIPRAKSRFLQLLETPDGKH
jgi:hypothetical protein